MVTNSAVEQLLDWRNALQDFLHLGLAFTLTAVIGWNREQEQHNLGIRTFPIVGVASCSYLMLMADPQGDAGNLSRALQGLITGIGFVGGGAIVKEGVTAHGTATAASVWCAGAIGASVALNHYAVAVMLVVLNLLALRGLLPLKIKLDQRKQDSGE